MKVIFRRESRPRRDEPDGRYDALMVGSRAAMHSVSSLAPSLCQTFDRLARLVWSTLENATRFGISYGEESLTDEILLQLVMNHSREIAVRKFTKHQEGTRTGADWEWWFGDRTAWFGMRVQAKVLDPRVNRYTSLSHRVRKTKKLQIDLLLQDARKRKLFPAYCFYNSWDTATTHVPWRCPRATAVLQFGCSLADARAIKILVANHQDDLAAVMQHAFPWTCLPCCPVQHTGALGLAGRVREFAMRLHAANVEAPRRPALPALTLDPPLYVRQLADQQGPLPEPGMPRFSSDRFPAAPTDGWPSDSVDGVLVIRDSSGATDVDTETNRRPRRPRSSKPRS